MKVALDTRCKCGCNRVVVRVVVKGSEEHKQLIEDKVIVPKRKRITEKSYRELDLNL